MNTEQPLLLQAYRGKRGARTPVWFMRQAGRFLPEYRELRNRHSLLELFRTPRLAAEVTLQPLRRYDLDAAIIFADILTPIIGLGFELDFVEGEGPRIANPLDDPGRAARLVVPPVEENVGYTLEAITLATEELRGRNIPLIGFCGAPFTLSCYLIAGGSPDSNLVKPKRFMLEHPEAWHVLQDRLAELLGDYLIAQVRAGARALQIFDSWLGGLAPREYHTFVEPHLTQLIARVRAAVDAPIVFFSTGTAGLLPYFSALGADCIGVDWRVSLRQAAALLGTKGPLQGNLDPALLCGPRDALCAAAADILEQGKELPAHVFNLGHGILPPTPIDNVAAVVDLIRGRA